MVARPGLIQLPYGLLQQMDEQLLGQGHQGMGKTTFPGKSIGFYIVLTLLTHSNLSTFFCVYDLSLHFNS